jgi:hypothetical protein
MKKAVINLALAYIGALTLAHESFAASAIENYELSERCSKRAEEDWKFRHQDLPGLYGPGSYVRYENHYNVKFNKCYVIHFITQPDGKGKTGHIDTLFDVNAHQEIASYIGMEGEAPIDCHSLESKCHSKAEWDQLIRPYWEE